jgi:hypothetical protein
MLLAWAVAALLLIEPGMLILSQKTAGVQREKASNACLRGSSPHTNLHAQAYFPF